MSGSGHRLDQISRVNALLAAQEGGEAFREGQPSTACPYGEKTQTERFLAFYWSEGWKAASKAV